MARFTDLWRKGRPILFAITGLLWLVTGFGRYEKGATGFLLIVPFLIALLFLAAALLWWINPKPRAG